LRTSVVIPAHNAEATLAACIEGCLRQSEPACEVIVVDDGSTDATGRVAQAFAVHYVRQENRGPAAARNRGAQEARGDVIAFTDADCVPEDRWLAGLAAGFDEAVVAVGGAYGIANPGHWLARMVHEEIAARHAHLEGDVDFLGSFNVAYRKAPFEAVGGFDASFRSASGEDNDLAYRLQDVGGRLRFTREAVVAHHHPTRLWPYLRTQARHGYWRMKLYAKHIGRARRGDQYAGMADLAAPPLALLVVALLGGVAVSALWHVGWPATAVALASASVLYVGLRVRMPLEMVRRSGDPGMALFLGVAALRDVARGLGMVAGMGRFFMMHRTRVR